MIQTVFVSSECLNNVTTVVFQVNSNLLDWLQFFSFDSTTKAASVVTTVVLIVVDDDECATVVFVTIKFKCKLCSDINMGFINNGSQVHQGLQYLCSFVFLLSGEQFLFGASKGGGKNNLNVLLIVPSFRRMEIL